MAVYLIHFSRPIGSSHPRGKASHYIGYSADDKLSQRLERHATGDGARLMAAVVEAGIDWEVVKTWPNGTRELERKIKSSKNSKRYCPICCGKKSQ